MEKKNRLSFNLIIVFLLLIWTIHIFFQYVINHAEYLISFNLFFTVIPDIIALSLLAFLAYCLGSTIIHYIFKEDLKSDIEFIFSSALGFIIFSIGTAAINFVQLLSIPIIFLFLTVLIIISSKQMVSCIKKFKLPFFKLDSNFDYILLFLLIIFILINFLFSLTPPIGPDEQQYHLTAPLRYIEHGGYFTIKNITSAVNFPQNVEMLYTLAIILKGDILAKLINFYFGILTLFLIKSITNRFFNFSSLLPSAIFYCGWVIYFVSTRALVELPQSFFCSIALFSLMIWLENRSNRQFLFYFYFSAITAGFSLGIKYTSLFSLSGLILIITFYHLFIQKKRISMLFPVLFRYVIIAFLLFSPWVIKNTILHGIPFYPYKITRQLSLASGLLSKNNTAPSIYSYFKEKGSESSKKNYFVYSLKELFLVPYNATIYGKYGTQAFDSVISPFYLMFLPLLIFIRDKNRVIIGFIFYSVTFLFFWIFLQPNNRYLTPIMPIMSVLIAYVIHWLSATEDMRIKKFSLIVKSIIIITITLTLFDHLRIFIHRNPVNYIFGAESKLSFLTRNNLPGIQPAINYINENLPPTANIYLLWVKRGYYLKRDYKEDAYGNIFASLMKKHEDTNIVATELKQTGVTHILCNFYIPKFWIGSSYDQSKENLKAKEFAVKKLNFFYKMADNNLEELFSNKRIRLYKIK